jgi:hypothetical protein
MSNYEGNFKLFAPTYLLPPLSPGEKIKKHFSFHLFILRGHETRLSAITKDFEIIEIDNTSKKRFHSLIEPMILGLP